MMGVRTAAWLGARWRFTRMRGETLTRFQNRRAARVVSHAVAHSAFYRAHYAGLDLSRWRELPIVDKSLMMERFDDFNTASISRAAAMEVAMRAESERDFRPTLAGLTVGLSSGTSGHRGLFLVSASEQARWAGAMLARAVAEWPARGVRVTFFLRSNSNLYERLNGPRLRLRWLDLTTPLEAAIAALQQEPPDYLVGPPSLLGLLAEVQEIGRLRIQPQRVISVAEVLEPQDRKRLSTAFHAPVGQIYQGTEGLLAVSCAHGGLHLQEDLVCVQLEPLGEDPDGVRMTPIVTDLWRRTQPILRYRLDDLVVIDPAPCACGSSFRRLARIEGRQEDVCWFARTDGGLQPFFPDTIRRVVLLCGAGIRDYQVIQEKPGHLRIHLDLAATPFDEVARELRRRVTQMVVSYDCHAPVIVVERGLIPMEAAQKRRRVRRFG